MKSNLIKGNSDFLLGIIIIMFSGVVFALACGIRNAEAAMLPKFLAIFMAVMGAGISVKSVVNRSGGNDDDVHVKGADIFTGIIIPGLFLLAAFVLISYLGFYVTEFLLIVSLMFLQDTVTNGKIDLSLKRLITVFLYALVTIIVMYLIFHFVFHLPTPKGIFGF